MKERRSPPYDARFTVPNQPDSGLDPKPIVPRVTDGMKRTSRWLELILNPSDINMDNDRIVYNKPLGPKPYGPSPYNSSFIDATETCRKTVGQERVRVIESRDTNRSMSTILNIPGGIKRKRGRPRKTKNANEINPTAALMQKIHRM